MLEKHSNIPLGKSCYNILKGPFYNEDGVANFQAECCPHYYHKDGFEGHCTKFDCKIIDQEKICELNESENEYDYE